MIKITFNNFYSNLNKQGICSRCKKRDTIIKRPHAGDSLCPLCFENYIEKKISRTISKYGMISSKDRVIVALSGGKDSITLLYNLIKYQERRYHSESLIALSINEGIKEYRRPGLEYAENMCKQYGIEHKIINFKEKIGKSLDEIVQLKQKTEKNKYTCNYCALIKRRLLNEEAKELNADILAMGHNLTDIAETFLMNVMYKRINLIGNQYPFKSADNRMNNHFVRKIFPLMKISEEEVFYYVIVKKFKFLNVLCPYRINEPIVRKRVFQFLQESKKYSPELEYNLLEGFLQLSKILHEKAPKETYNTCLTCGYPTGVDKKLCNYCKFLQELNKKN